jgi:hypothetical protein
MLFFASFAEAVVLWLVVRDTDTATYVFPVTWTAFLLAEAGAMTRSFDGVGRERLTQLSFGCLMISFVLFIGTVAAASSQALADPGVPSLMQWILPLVCFVVVVGSRSALKEMSS